MSESSVRKVDPKTLTRKDLIRYLIAMDDIESLASAYVDSLNEEQTAELQDEAAVTWFDKDPDGPIGT